MHDRVASNWEERQCKDGLARSVPQKRPNLTQRNNQPSLLQRIIGNQAFQRQVAVDPDGQIPGTRTAPRQSAASPGIAALEDQGTPESDDELIRLQSDAGVPGGVGDAGAPSPAGDAGVAAPKLSPSLSIIGTGAYTDTTESHKKVTYNATWSGGSKEDYIIVQWVKGFVKHADGTPFKASLYGSQKDVDFADWVIDSVDEDPAYWSDGPVRWRYTVDGPNKFSATDDPVGMKKAWGEGTKARLDFQTAVYKSADVPTTTTGSISATPLTSFENWNYYAELVPENYVELHPPLKFDHS